MVEDTLFICLSMLGVITTNYIAKPKMKYKNCHFLQKAFHKENTIRSAYFHHGNASNTYMHNCPKSHACCYHSLHGVGIQKCLDENACVGFLVVEMLKQIINKNNLI